MVLVVLYHLVKAVLKEVFKVAIAAYVWRHLTGAHYHGEKRSDAGWFTHGTKGYGRDGQATKWELKPRAHRAAWRWALTFGFFGVIFGLCVALSVTLHALLALAVYGVVVLGFVIESKVRLRVHNRHVINPIVKSLAVQLRLNPHAVRRLFHLKPEDIKDEGEVGYLELPPEITPGDDQKSSIERIIDAHLPVDIEVDWRMQQAPKLGVIRAGLRPPVMVSWDEIAADMARAAYGEIVIGKDRYKNVFTANFIHLEDPHWAFSVQTKRGKSNFLGLVAVQVLHQDPLAQITVIDPKEESLIDFLGAPWTGVGTKPLLKGVTMANDPEDVEAMWAAVHRAKVMMDRRRAEYARDRTKRFPVHLVMLDELNMFKELTIAAWNDKLAANKRLDKEDQEDLPRECPVWADIRAMLHMGRFVGIHVIAVAQDFRAEILGGHGARNGFGFRGMGGFLPNQWKMFIGTTPVPAAQVGVGRWVFWQGEQQDWVQIARVDADKAYAWAAIGREQFDAEAALGCESVQTPVDTVLSASLSGDATDGHTVELDARRVIVGLREAAKYLGYAKPDSFRKARERYIEDSGSEGLPGEFRQGRSPAWPADKLDEWLASRPRRTKGDSSG